MDIQPTDVYSERVVKHQVEPIDLDVAERQPQFVHVLSRSIKYPFSDVRRFYFPDFLVDWQVRVALNPFFWPF